MTSLSRTVSQFGQSRYMAPVFSGVLLGVSFPSYPFLRFEILAWVALVPLLLSLRTVEKAGELFRRVYLAMLLFSLISLWWVSLATLPGGVLTLIAEAFFLTVPFFVFYVVKKLAGFHFALFALPFFWVAWEWLYMQQDLSLGWLTLGNSQSNLNLMVQYADLTGVWGVSFWLLWFNVLAVLAITGGRREVVSSVSFMVLMILVPLIYAYTVFHRDALIQREDKKLRVTLVQPNIDPHEKWVRRNSSDIIERYYRLTNTAVRENRPDLVMWPETAIPFYILDRPYADDYLSLRVALRGWNTGLLTGFSDIIYFPAVSHTNNDPTVDSDQFMNRVFETYNASMLLEPGYATPQIYRKMRLVPFAERVPYVEYLPWLGHLTFSLAGLNGWGKGHDTTIMKLHTSRIGKVNIANIICYESIFPDLVTEFVRKGAQVLTLVTNDGWYATSYGPYQHLAIGKMRCIENRRAMARCANTGLTVVIDKYGRIIAEIPWWQERTLNAEVPLESKMTFFTLNPDLLPKAALFFSGLLLIIAVIKKAKKTISS
ncbi:MAG: apolipoprotein N-acyltransferase [Chlorobium sp.]|jgi:apolipoprotein N-acyltransferase|nr:MAG: apolipoprotein N-acyltransferase [Chlorobium sp.]